MLEIRGADFVQYSVSDLTRSVAFYRDIAGLPCRIESLEHQWAEFDCGNITLALKGGALAVGSTGQGRIALAVTDVHVAHQVLLQRKAAIISGPQNHGCCWHLEVHDPDGNQIILHQRADGTCG